MTVPLDPFFEPESIAVVGASNAEGKMVARGQVRLFNQTRNTT